MAEDMNREDRDRLIQIGSAVERLVVDMAEVKSDMKVVSSATLEIALLKADVTQLRQEISTAKRETEEANAALADYRKVVKEEYVSKVDFEPIKKVYYTVITLIVTAVVVAVLALVIV